MYMDRGWPRAGQRLDFVTMSRQPLVTSTKNSAVFVEKVNMPDYLLILSAGRAIADQSIVGNG